MSLTTVRERRSPRDDFLSLESSTIWDIWPKLASSAPFVRLGDWPTPVQSMVELGRSLSLVGELYVKRDDRSSPVCGGNKVRPLEVLFGFARRRGATKIFATGAFGSNHAVATVLHAPRAGLEAGAVLFPQPVSPSAVENVRVTVSRAARFVALPHWSALPFGMAWTRRSEEARGARPFFMVPGGATPIGALGYVNAALELAQQVARDELPPPSAIVVPAGSTCTAAGFLVGFALAARLGIGFAEGSSLAPPPELVAVNVTPRIVSNETRIVALARRTARLVASLARDESLDVERALLARHLTVDGRFLGRGYGYDTPEGRRAVSAFRETTGLALDPIYSGKAAAAFIDRARRRPGVTLFWATKSSAPLPAVTLPEQLPRSVARFIERLSRR
ncbi:MAG TPA: pyridoxal-phosphate dependent enzyme [Polyangiaceae bacterium]|nr:pyridoxal-phosphate dependent enzyme [Polyangiaceae bacterium]